MVACMDFLNWLVPDMSLKVLTCLDDPSDLVRVTSVSRSWRHSGELNRFHIFGFFFKFTNVQVQL